MRRSTQLIVIVLCIAGLYMPTVAEAATSFRCPGEEGYLYTNYRNRNPQSGGFVSHSAFVEDSVFIAPTAAVCGSASVLDSARVYGTAVVMDEAEVSGDARVYGSAQVSGTAVISGKAKVSDHARISGTAIVEGRAWFRGYKAIATGVFAEGTHSAEKPQSVIQAEAVQAKRNALDELVRIMEIAGKIEFEEKVDGYWDEHWVRVAIAKTSDPCVLDLDQRFSARSASRSQVDFNKAHESEVFHNGDDVDFRTGNEYCVDRSFCFYTRSQANELLDKMKQYQSAYCSSPG
ncbi:MAG: hypothetical protein GY716_19065 [bacterium]|nr:hypothetical protein [bacterium]